ncbi:amino acid adenylation domain-containing protein [Zhouia spongiae]|uniref:Amino acid adenylation domain-containing protein n=1 Tax=Zhouia spongiae TaxID=2202721 RepID=A0ABY3YSP4_9FLAO|nr:amino acid adenylation domain-containing protein [Zhouia spongiae]
MYTSGSTGEPKGVMIEHKSVVNLICFQSEYFNIQSNESFLLFSSVSFDASVEQLFLPLLNGARINIALKTEILNEEKFKGFLEKNKITHLHAVPSFLRMLSSNPILSLKRIISGGDKFDTSVFRKWKSQVSVYNKYGLTEATVTSVEYLIDEGKTLSSPIGKPIANTSIYILGTYKELLPVGVSGEIYIGGDGLARGYFNRPELTAEKFIDSPFNEGERLYKTGDLGRWLIDGNIEFIGRNDNQVKIRGHRIELEEIAKVLETYLGIDEVVVLATGSISEEKELVAYFTSNKKPEVQELRNFLKERIPDYMLPTHYVYLEKLPLTSNGKVDKKELLSKQIDGLTRRTEYIAPRNELEKNLVLIWKEVLKRDNIGIQDNFYDLGGDSIKSIQVVSRLKNYGYTIKVEDILRNPVIEDLSKLAKVNSRVIDQSEVEGEVFLTPIQHSFFNDDAILTKHHYNQSVLLHSYTELDINGLTSCFEYITNHHDGLRMVYHKEDNLWKQNNLSYSPERFYDFNYYDLKGSEEPLLLMGKYCETLQESITLSEGPLFKAALFRLKDGDRLFLMVHHLVIDGVSWRILLDDLATLYLQYINNSTLTLPLKTDSFRDWSQALNDYAHGDKLAVEHNYWENLLTSNVIDLPKDQIDRDYNQRDYSELSFVLDTNITELLQTRTNRVFNTEINDILLTSFGLSINDVFDISRVFVKMEGHGREDIISDIDITRTVGWFTSVYPYLLEILPEEDALGNLVYVKESLRKVPNKGIGYGILKELASGFSTEIKPKIVFNYLGDFGSGVGSEESKQSSLFQYSSEYRGRDIPLNNNRDISLNVSGVLVDGVLRMSISYSKRDYNKATISRLISSYKYNLEKLILKLNEEEKSYLTPDDLTYKGLSILDVFNLNKKENLEDVYKLSPLQEGIYYHWLSDRNPTMYFEQISYVIEAHDLDIKLLKQSYDLLISRHAVLRTSFSTDYGGEAVQIVWKEVESTFVYDSAPSGLSEDEQKEYLTSYKELDRKKGFDLSTGSQMRLIVLNLKNGHYQFIWSHHHILTDGWCMSILINDFYKLMFSVQHGTEPNLEPVIPYSNYIKWLSNVDKQSSLDYWKEYLHLYNNIIEFPFRLYKEETVSSYKEGKESLYIKSSLLKAVNELCVDLNITQNTFIQGVWGYLLAQYNNIEDVVFGSVVSGRPSDLKGVESMIGLFINTIPVRVQFAENDSPKELLKMIQRNAISGMSHHYISLSEVQSLSEPGAKLLNHVMTFGNYSVQESSNIDLTIADDLSVVSREIFEQTNYDFGIQVAPGSDELIINFTYNLNNYDRQGVLKLKQHFFNVINSFVSDPNQLLGKINYLTSDEEIELLCEFNETATIYPKEKTIVDLFEEQVEKTPNRVAVVFEGKELTYCELNERANQLAHYLQNKGVKPESLVGICVERSLEMIVGLLGILKAGGAYVPIDPSYPKERISYILKDSNCGIVISQVDIELPETTSEIIYLDADRNKITTGSVENVVSELDGNNLAYVIYTSGSTGYPKGTLINHYSVSRIAKRPKYVDVSINDNVLQLSNFAFDGSVFDIYTTLLNGAKLVLVRKEMVVDIEKLANFILSEEISVFFVTTALFNTIVDFDVEFLKNIKKILFGGEQVSQKYVNEAYSALGDNKIVHVYGPTESTVFASFYQVSKLHSGTIPIGKPIDNTEVYILDEAQSLVPIGVVGEICISGDGLARGYLNRPELTAAKFVDNPFNEGDRLYKTGDLGRWLPDGNIEFIGRKDSQVKIRGFRIELGEVEHVLQGNTHVISCVVDVTESSSGDKDLVAYFVGSDSITSQELREYMGSLLPSYMIPSYFVKLEELPLTSNGKLDRKSLPELKGLSIDIGIEYLGPRNEIEEQLVGIWSDVLDIPEGEISVTANFFELGGHSLKVLKLSSKLYKDLGLKVSIQDLFTYNSILSQAELISESEKECYQEIPKVEKAESYVLSSSQRRLWVLSQFESANVAYNMSSVHELGLIDVETLESSFNKLIARHESLRTIFRENDEGDVRQFILEEMFFKIDYEDLEGISTSDLRDRIAIYRNRSFDLSEGPLLRGAVYRLSKDHYVFVYVMHHIISDGVSMETLFGELISIYDKIEKGTSLELTPLRIQYKDYAEWQQSELKSGALSVSRNYWLDQFKGELPVLDLPTDYTRPMVKSYKGGKLKGSLIKIARLSLKDY